MKVLLVDDDADVREIIAFTIESQLSCEINEVDCGNTAIEEIKLNPNYDLIVCDYNMPDGNGGEVYNYLIDNNIDIPYVFCSSDFSEDHSEFNDKSRMLCEITKPRIFEGIETMVEALKVYNLRNNQESTPVNEEDYCTASLDLVAHCKQLPCDIYLLVSGKYLKTFKAGDEFSSEDKEKFESKNVENFLVKREDSKKFVHYVVEKVISILEDTSLKVGEKVLSVHDVIMDTIRELGMSESVARAAKSSVDFTLKYFDQNDETKNLRHMIFGDPERSYLTRHSVGISYISVGILKQTSWDSPENRNKLVMSAFMHDISVKKRKFTESKFSEKNDLEEIKDHPKIAIDVLKSMKEIPEDVFKIISDHHERPDGSGFPRAISGDQISPLASIFIFSHDIVDAMYELIKMDEVISLESVKKIISKFEYSQGKFPRIFKAFEKAELFQGV